jgi:hypothetical protein
MEWKMNTPEDRGQIAGKWETGRELEVTRTRGSVG